MWFAQKHETKASCFTIRWELYSLQNGIGTETAGAFGCFHSVFSKKMSSIRPSLMILLRRIWRCAVFGGELGQKRHRSDQWLWCIVLELQFQSIALYYIVLNYNYIYIYCIVHYVFCVMPHALLFSNDALCVKILCMFVHYYVLLRSITCLSCMIANVLLCISAVCVLYYDVLSCVIIMSTMHSVLHFFIVLYDLHFINLLYPIAR